MSQSYFTKNIFSHNLILKHSSHPHSIKISMFVHTSTSKSTRLKEWGRLLEDLWKFKLCLTFQAPQQHKMSEKYFYIIFQPKNPEKSNQLPQQKPTVQLTFSNGSITNVSVNISEELGKTSIWKQLTEGGKSEGNARNIS